MSVIFNGNKIIPAPLPVFRKTFDRSPDGRILGSKWNVTINGTIVAEKGSPNSSKVFWTAADYPPDETLTNDQKLGAILRKQEALRTLFSSDNDYKLFEIQPLDGSPPCRFNPRIVSISFDQRGRDPWVNTCNYTIELETDCLYILGSSDCEDSITTDKISGASEDWAIETFDETNTAYRLTHRVSAVGKRSYDIDGNLTLEAWKNASGYVLGQLQLGISDEFKASSGVLNLAAYSAYNYSRTQNISETNGEFSVTESWLLYNDIAIEEFTADVRNTTNDGFTTVSIQGTIRGLEERDNTTYELITSRYTNASGKYNEVSSLIHNRAQEISNTPLNPVPLNQSVNHNQRQGTISYNYEYNNRTANLVPNSLSESIDLNIEHATDVIAQISVIGRAAGPIIQDIGTTTPSVKSFTMEVVMPVYSGLTTMPNVESIWPLFEPSADVIKITRNTERWNPYNGRYSRGITWTYEV